MADEITGTISQIQVGGELYNIVADSDVDVVEYTDQEIISLVLETPDGITPIANASGVSF